QRLVAACVDALPALVAGTDAGTPTVATDSEAPATPLLRTLEVAGHGTSALVALDAAGARLLLFPGAGRVGRVSGGGPAGGGAAGLSPGCGSMRTPMAVFGSASPAP